MTHADFCDCCKAPMKYRRLAGYKLYACEDCRGDALKALGRTVTAVAIGPAASSATNN